MIQEHYLEARTASCKNIDEASAISQWTIDSGTMLPKTQQQLLDLFKNGDSVLVYDSEGDLVSHAAITYTYSDGSVEIGCVITDKEKRRNGAATHAVKEALRLAHEKYPGRKIFALANESSSILFERIGGIQIETIELSAEVWEPCVDCPRRPQQTKGKPFVCCDTPYDLTHLK